MEINILTIDDSMNVRSIVKSYLEVENYLVSEACDGVDGLKKVKEKQFDLIIVDVNMPNMDGITFVKEVRKLLNYRNTPIIILTTESQEQKKLDGMRAGANGWVVKPFTGTEFGKVVKRLLESKK